jgi:hypothetical protein
MSLNNDIVVTKRPKSESAVATPRQDGWLASINPLQSRSQDSPTISDINKEPVPIENDSDDDVQSTGWFDFSFKKIAIIILILLFLGFNVLKMSGAGLGFIATIAKVLFGSFGVRLSDTIKNTVKNSATGSKEIIDVTKDVAIDAVDDVDELLGVESDKKNKKSKDKKDNENLAEAIDKVSKQNKDADVMPDDSGSTVQQSKGAGKAGWCFTGEDRGFRSCVKVGINDECMSGDIFPSKDICVNPSLRE